jgi:hypothetical protein
MTDPEVRRILEYLAGPTGPMSSEDQRATLRQRLTSGDRAAAAERLLTALADWGPLRSPDDVEGEVSDLLAELADDDRVPPMLIAAVHDARTREAALDALALNPKPAVHQQLAGLAAEFFGGSYPEDAQIRFISALASYGPVSQAVLADVAAHPALTPAVRAELAIALRWTQGEPSSRPAPKNASP